MNEKTVAELAAHVGGRTVGDDSTPIKSVAGIESAGPGEVAFIEDLKLLPKAGAGRASCLIVPQGAPEEQTGGPCLIKVARPKLAFALIAEVLHPPVRRAPAIHPTAQVDQSAQVDESAYIGARVEVGARSSLGPGTQVHAGVVIGQGVRIGRDCVLHPHVVLYDGVSLGDRVILHAGVVVGADGFGYVPDERNVRHKFPQLGTVLIEDDVEVGAGTCIDRGALGPTRIGRATKIDNLVQIAHNVEIGERVVVAAQTGISGSTVIEDDVVIGGQVGLGDHARVMSGAVIGSKAGILPGKIVRAGVWWGVPVQPLEQYKRLSAHLARVPLMRDELKDLRRRLKELEERLGGEE
ncbi:MAG TPA: UDP-3-O-(3-hydroxymyristoyl)glucosamine N-acyltransferase [Pyrinomonadaceae bacterium]|jgi:UDP-3-O-[3-hydroxymyristoyl] glucosamine N-acyltransferase